MRVAVALVLCAPLLAGSAWLTRNDEDVRKGRESYQAGDFLTSARYFRKAMAGSADSNIVQFNLGTALARQGAELSDPEARGRALALAVVAIRSALDSPDPELRRSAHYNTGNALLLAERYDEAIESFKVVLRDDPSHDWARHNLELAQRLRRTEFALDRVATSAAQKAISGADNDGPSPAEDGQAGPQSEGGPASTGAASGTGDTEAGQGEGTGDRTPSSPPPPPENSDDGQAMRAEPRSMAEPQDADDSSIVQKLEALERRSGELRRSRVLRKTQSTVRSFGKTRSTQ